MARPTEHADLFEIMYTCRAMRRLKPDPVPDDVIEQLIDAAIHSPSGSNAQNWKFIVVRDRATLAKIQQLWRQAWAFYGETVNSVLRPGEDSEAKARQTAAGTYMVEHMHEVPALIFVCAKEDKILTEAFKSPKTLAAAVRHFGLGGTLRLLTAAGRTSAMAAGGAAFPAVQNLLLAARALGIGAVLTTPQAFHPGRYEALLGIPKGDTLCAVIPIGYPVGRFGPVKRAGVADVLSWDTY